MQKREKVLVFGYFGKRSHIMEGQSVKTRNMSRLLRDMGCDVSEFDTESFRYDPLSVAKMLVRLMRCDKVCVLPAHNNLKLDSTVDIYIVFGIQVQDISIYDRGAAAHISAVYAISSLLPRTHSTHIQ